MPALQAAFQPNNPPALAPLTRAARRFLAGSALAPLTLCLLQAAGPAAAQPAASEDTLATTTVTASPDTLPADVPPPFAGGQVARGARSGLLGNKDVFETPFSVQSFTSELVRNTQAASLGDVLSNDPSVRNNLPRNSQTEAFTIRGFALVNSEVAFDGLFGILPTQSTPAEFFERVELIKGPSALLLGTSLLGNIGGAVNTVPKRAGDRPNASVTVDYGSDKLSGVAVDVGQRFGPDKALGLRFNGVKRTGRAAGDHPHDRTAGLLALDYRGERFRLAGEVGVQDQRDEADTNYFSVLDTIAVPAPPKNMLSLFQPWSYVDTEEKFGAVRGEWDVSDNLTAYAAYGQRETYYTRLNARPTITNTNGTFTATPSLTVLRNAPYRTAQAGLRGKLQTGSVSHAISVQASQLDNQTVFQLTNFAPARTSSFNNPVLIPQPNTSAVNLNPPVNSRTVLDSLAVADVMSFLDSRLQVTVGARQQEIETRNIALSGVQTPVYSKNKVSPSAAVLYKFTPGWSGYVSYIEGLSQGATAPAGSVNAGEQFAPFVSQQYEAGVKYEAGTLGLTAALFQIAQPSGFLSTATNRFGVDGEQRNRGLELNAFGEIRRGWRVLGGVLFLDGEQTQTQNGRFDGRAAPGAPKVQLTLGTDMDVPGMPGLALNGRVFYTSAQYLNQSNTQRIPGWTRLDIGARYATRAFGRALTLRANIENLADKRYWASATAGSLGYSAPRTFLISATVDF